MTSKHRETTYFHAHLDCGHVIACGNEMNPADVVRCIACKESRQVERVCGRNF